MTQDYAALYGIQSVDFDQYTSALKNTNANGIVSGLAVSQRGAGANMSVDVAAGEARGDGTRRSFGSVTNLAISAADGTNPRKDLVVMNTAGTLLIRTGTPASADPSADIRRLTKSPRPPEIAVGDIVLAEVWVDTSVTQIFDADISDRRTDVNEDIDLGNAGVINFGATIRLLRGVDNRLDLLSGDNFNLVLGDYMIAGVTVINSVRDLVGLNQVAQHLDPNAGNTFDLGDGTLRWRDLYLQGVIRWPNITLLQGTTTRLDLSSGDSFNLVSGGYMIAATTVINSSRDLVGLDAVAQHLDPNAANTYDLGDATRKWRNLYLDQNILMDAGQTVDGVDVSELSNKDVWLAVELADLTIGPPTFSDVSGVRPFWKGLGFATGVNNAAEWRFIIPRDWDGTSNFQVKMYWVRASTGTGTNVVWQANFVAVAAGENVDSPGFTNISTTTRAVPAVDILEVFDMGGMTSAQVAVGDIVNLEIFRDGDDAADDFSIGVTVLGIKLEYTAG